MVVELLRYPNDDDWMEVKRRALVTIGKRPISGANDIWKRNMLRARHSPIRYLQFSFYLEVPYYVSVHLARHVHAQPYIRSQRNDRQDRYDRNNAPQNAVVSMIWDMNAEEFITVCNKRLCNLADETTRKVVKEMVELVKGTCPEFEAEMVPVCVREKGCNEIYPCSSKR